MSAGRFGFRCSVCGRRVERGTHFVCGGTVPVFVPSAVRVAVLPARLVDDSRVKVGV